LLKYREFLKKTIPVKSMKKHITFLLALLSHLQLQQMFLSVR